MQNDIPTLPDARFKNGSTEIIFQSQPELVTIQSMSGTFKKYIRAEQLVEIYNERHLQHPLFSKFCECKEAVNHLALKYRERMRF